MMNRVTTHIHSIGGADKTRVEFRPDGVNGEHLCEQGVDDGSSPTRSFSPAQTQGQKRSRTVAEPFAHRGTTLSDHLGPLQLPRSCSSSNEA